jgi:threonine/homoserine/homoserine lactone efflux protein
VEEIYLLQFRGVRFLEPSMNSTQLGLFLSATFFITIVPGPAIFYVVTRSITEGKKSGFVATAGLGLGVLLHVLLAVCGLSAILAASPMAFKTLKILGGLYLIYLGVSKFMEKRDARSNLVSSKNKSARKVFKESLIVQILNPQVAFFFLSFLPQFIDPKSGHVPMQILSLGLIFVLMACIVNSSFTLFSETLYKKLIRQNSSTSNLNRFAALVFVGLGIFALLQ